MDSNGATPEQVSKVERELASLIPWVPTPFETAREILEVAQVGSKDIVYDLGCGDARMLIMAVKECGVQKAVGYEIRQDLLEDANQEIQRQNVQNQITLVRGDLLDADLSEASVIVLYLSAIGNDRLRPKLEKEAEPGTRIVSYNFPISTWQTDRVESCSKGKLYLYLIPQAFQNSSANNTTDK